jgi:hypothetical protein
MADFERQVLRRRFGSIKAKEKCRKRRDKE